MVGCHCDWRYCQRWLLPYMDTLFLLTARTSLVGRLVVVVARWSDWMVTAQLWLRPLLLLLLLFFFYLAHREPGCWTAAFAAVWQLGRIPSPAVSFGGRHRVVAITVVVAGCCWRRLRLSFFNLFFLQELCRAVTCWTSCCSARAEGCKLVQHSFLQIWFVSFAN